MQQLILSVTMSECEFLLGLKNDCPILQIKTSAVAMESVPLQLESYWKCEPRHTDFHLNYKFNGTAMMPHATLSKVTVTVPVDGNVTNVQSKPNASW